MGNRLSISRKQRPYLKRFARIHFWITAFSFFAYVGFGFVFGPEFFKADIMNRLSALADDIITVTAVVLGPPTQPSVTATPVCVSGAPRIVLDWADDAATDTWDINRDSLPLSTGRVVSNYTDTAVVPNATYEYVVTAYGPMAPGTAVSDPVSATALDCPNILPPATVTIETLGGRSVTSSRTGITLDRTRPQVTGTTNIPDAIVEITLTNPSINARLVANANGYFSWIPPVRIDNGSHTLTVTVIDPADSSRTATDTLTFRTKDGDANDGSQGGSSIVPFAETPNVSARGQETIGFSLKVNNGAEFIFQGDPLDIVVTSTGQAFPIGTAFSGFLLDASGKEAVALGAPFDGSGQSMFHLERKAPLSIEPGAYRIRVDAALGGRITSREVTIDIRAWPLIRFGENTEVTYYEVASLIGTIFLSLLSLLVLLLLLFVREYWLYMHHLRHVTERQLKSMGFISPKGKGVAK